MSDIVASSDPRAAASRLVRKFRAWAAAASRGPAAFPVTPEQKVQYTREGIAAAAAALVDTVRRLRPLVHQVFLTQQPYTRPLLVRCNSSADSGDALDHEQRRQDAIRKCHARTGRIAHHG